MTQTLRKYLLVIKPGIVAGNLVSVAGGFLLAAGGRIDGALLAATIFGTSLVVASGCIFNNCIDRHLDRKMVRTQNRVMARGLIALWVACCYATLLGLGGVGLLLATTNKLTTAIAIVGFADYVVIYSLWLKQASVYSILVGSLSGATPPLVGYCAVRGRLDMGAIILLAIFALWQIPHAYAIALYRRQDYTAAAIPMLPLRGEIGAARRQIISYILAYTAAASMLTFGGYAGYGYLTAVMVAGLGWLGLAWAGYTTGQERLWARRIFIFSVASITLLSLMMAIDGTSPFAAHLLATTLP
ncbi:MAG: heme o synthase [Desulfobacteraceae bacterium]|nr:heme o synthase [Desulfobacteraceae bacterium]